MDKNFIKNYDENGGIRFYFDVDVECPKKLHDSHSDLPFLPERMKVNKCNKLICNLYNKKNHAVHIRTLKQALMQGLKLKKVHKVPQFNQKRWLKPYIDMNILLKKRQKTILKKTFLSS